ncbi:hypothetical protein ACGFWG_05360 [Streptomyces sp. NPDC048405]|uniref:hypothetical protein n=1 Tax=Streptomyces TaxID=1883 RepID=UPI0018D6373E|nr:MULTISPECIES: hypothetical protein [Streptomyces]MBH5133020.1 hypothetical protein [Streptomyces sp. HB-N217]WSU01025.1 hypothetical protein OG368_10640 [Streptomyces sp. NBC_01124]
MQATAYTYDPESRSGQVLLDDGTPVPFDAAAFDAGGLRLLRPGQRVRIETEAGTEGEGEGEADGEAGAGGGTRGAGLRITLVTLQTF